MDDPAFAASFPNVAPIIAALVGLACAIMAALVVLVLTPRLLPTLRRRAMDAPNARSSHTVPTPRGGGLALCAALALTLGPAGMVVDAVRWAWPLLAALALGVLCWRDDRAPLPAALRFGVQIAAIVAGLAALGDGLVFQGLAPPLLDRLLAGFAWAWFVNLTNFMDGIDGITIADIGVAGAGLGVVALAGGAEGAPVVIGFALAGAALGFVPYNWPAKAVTADRKVFLGDVGSIPLGYVAGLGILLLAANGAWASAIILPAYSLADATLTLSKRLWRRERVWQAHRSHFYQRAAARAGHAAVSARVALANAGLAMLAVAALHAPWAALAGATLLVVALLAWMEWTARK